MSELQFVFVHGLSGWGSYDDNYRKMPYWGMRGGDLMVYLRSQGFACYAASVAPAGSAWDRACELYAQLAGTRTDYGRAHSTAFQHERFGRDFTGRPLLPEWHDSTRLVLLGHSFGGAAVRLFSALMAEGSEEEKKATEPADLCPLFAGGMAGRIHTLVTLAAPMNGTTAYDMFEDPAFDPAAVKVPWWSGYLAAMMARGTKPAPDGRDRRDYAAYDMHIDNALAMNARIPTLADTYYYSVPCCATRRLADGTCVPVKEMEPLFVMRSAQIGAYRGMTAGGVCIDESWRDNDGLVNTVSAMVPDGAPSASLDRNDIRPGIWNVFPVLEADHMYLQGGLMCRHDIRPFYLDLLDLIVKTEKNPLRSSSDNQLFR
ncbi:MAG: hypothetical protein IJI33_02645 [Solobacterium sp.]|nr:hypothetical protein [Solobacterium sp.]